MSLDLDIGDLENLWASEFVFFSSWFFQEQMSLEILNLSLKNSPNSDFFLLNLSLENSPNSALEFGEFSKLNPWVGRFWKKHEFGDFAPEFGEFSKLSFFLNEILENFPTAFLEKKIREFFLLILSLENSPNSALEFAEFSKLNSWVWRILQTQKKILLNLSLEIWRILQTQHLSLDNSPNSFWFVKKKHVFGILFLLNLSSGKSPNSTLEFGEFSKLNLWVCVFFNFRCFFRKKWVWRFWTWVWRKSPNSKKNMRAKVFFKQKTPSARIFCYQKNFCTHIFFWVWRFSPNSGSKSPNSFFSKKHRKLKNTHTQRLSLENILQTQGLSLEISPNSDSKETKSRKHVVFQKPKWVWRILQTQVLSLENSPNSDSFFFLSLENSPNSSSKSKTQRLRKNPKLRGWVWRILQTQIQKKDFSDFGEISKLKGWVWRILQIPVQNLQTHSFLKKIQTQRLSLENSPNSMVENSPNSGFFQKHPQP